MTSISSILCFLALQERQDLEIDWEGVVLNDCTSTTGRVVVPETECPLDDEALEELQRTVDPVGPSQSFDRDLFIEFLHKVSHMNTSNMQIQLLVFETLFYKPSKCIQKLYVL